VEADTFRGHGQPVHVSVVANLESALAYSGLIGKCASTEIITLVPYGEGWRAGPWYGIHEEGHGRAEGRAWGGIPDLTAERDPSSPPVLSIVMALLKTVVE